MSVHFLAHICQLASVGQFDDCCYYCQALTKFLDDNACVAKAPSLRCRTGLCSSGIGLCATGGSQESARCLHRLYSMHCVVPWSDILVWSIYGMWYCWLYVWLYFILSRINVLIGKNIVGVFVVVYMSISLYLPLSWLVRIKYFNGICCSRYVPHGSTTGMVPTSSYSA